MLMFEPVARTVSIRVYGRYQNRRKKSNLETQMERLMKHTDLEEQGDAPKLLKTAGIGMLHYLASSTSIPLAKILGRSSGTCATFLKGICADNQDFVTELDVDTLLCS